MKMEKEYHTLNEGIPANARKGDNYIYMETGGNRNSLSFYVSGTAVGPKSDNDTFKGTIAIRLSREDAWNLIEEITKRLF